MKFPRFKNCLTFHKKSGSEILGRVSPFFLRLGALVLPLASMGHAAMAQTATKAPESAVSWWQSIVLGLVQGLTEFIPVSSSAHLNITHALMGHPRELAFDVMLSIGTTLALAWYYRHDWKALLTDPKQAKLRNLVFLACLPAVLFALPIHKFEDKPPLSLPTFNALMLFVAGLVLLIADKTSRQNRDLGSVSAKDSILVGIGQAMALIPGVSRSGATLTAGRFLGFNREDAMRFSFLMSLPISVAAIVFKYKDFGHINAPISSLVLGTVASAVSGFWAIGFLFNFLRKRDVTPFFVWRALVAVVVFALAHFGILK
ncbi:undecaprenyl-diphosphatase [Abditibacterium utsteinense]|uniref:Undecaprenyl-diphosphatase n=1 Tax=Abditibacterium utsteinense TaxID=1960156 RepID=A0A2S8SRL3_9BACT|nr:undecaprenyl-diphosphate phosphatase [Abditibacterium utsteinense]PQV63418.1 undecaprenyl-diphosphatase [Abditibacterium utsteinense]